MESSLHGAVAETQMIGNLVIVPIFTVFEQKDSAVLITISVWIVFKSKSHSPRHLGGPDLHASVLP